MTQDQQQKEKNFKKIIRETYKKSDAYKFDQLIIEQKNWQRKFKIASNKLLKVNQKINKLMIEKLKS